MALPTVDELKIEIEEAREVAALIAKNHKMIPDYVQKYKDAVKKVKELYATIRTHPEFNKKRTPAATQLLTDIQEASLDGFLMKSRDEFTLFKSLLKRVVDTPEGYELMTAQDGDGETFRSIINKRIDIRLQKHTSDIAFAAMVGKFQGMCCVIEKMEAHAT